MWKRLIFPTVAVAVLWALVSGATTWYIYWLGQSYQRVFSENVEAVYSASRIQEAAWKALTDAYASGTEPPLANHVFASTLDTFEQELPKLKRVSLSEVELGLMKELDRQFAGLKLLLHSLRTHGSESTAIRQSVLLRQLTDLTKEIAGTTDRLRDLNQKFAGDANVSRDQSTAMVFMVRTSILIIGPALGIAYGWWMARRLQSSVARITVTLRDATVGDRSLGAVNIDELQDLDALESQVALVVERLNHANDELKRARDEVLRSERLAAVGELAAGVAHELRNPLTSVKLLLQHLAQRGHTETLTGTKLQLILDEIARMESTIQGLLDFSRPPRLNRVRHDVRESLRRAMNLVAGRAQQQQIQISAELGDDPLNVDADPEQLHQVFVNLLLNGLESMPDGGQLMLHADSPKGGQSVQVQVRDSGTGIPEEILKRLFEPFATTKDRGTGLGLAVSRRIVIDHRGTITASNGSGGGAVFEVMLPLV
jgi:two-component system sensor histidine kinase HydH